jgi:cell wall-associated NlpC family hydrolase
LPQAVPGAGYAPDHTSGLRSFDGLHRLILLLLAIVFAGTLLAIAPAAAQAAPSEATRVVNEAERHLGKPWVYAATGPRSFDCSGLVFRVFKDTGLIDRIGNTRKTVRGYYNWFKQRGLVSRSNPRVGDLVVWGDNKHIGIYVGNGMAISTLTSGVTRHGIHRLTNKFKAFLHVRLTR